MRLFVLLLLVFLIFVPLLLRIVKESRNGPQKGHCLRQVGLIISIRYRPRLDFSHTSVVPAKHAHAVFIVLLLAGDIATNPGPPFSLAFVNVQSIKNKSGTVSNYTNSYKPDILAVCETWLTELETPASVAEITPNGYSLHHIPRHGRRGGGVGVFVRKPIKCSTIPTPAASAFEHITLQVRINKHDYNLVSLYRPPNMSFTRFLEDFTLLLETLYALPSQFIICGDFNIHVDSDTSNTKSFLSMLETWNLKQCVDFSTHLHGHTLDLLLLPSTFDSPNRIRPTEWISDHKCVTASFSFLSPAAAHQNQSITYRNFKDINLDKLKKDLNNSALVTSPCVTAEESYDQFHKTLTDLIDKHAPLQLKKHMAKRVCLWTSPEILKAKRTKRQFERMYKREKSPLNRSRLRKQINLFNRLVSKAKDAYYRDIINKTMGNSKQLWNTLNRVLHRTPDTILPEHTCEKSLADTFSSYFINKIATIRAGFATDSHSIDLQPDTNPPVFTRFTPMCEEEVLKIIKSSPPKSCSLDPWPTFLILECLDILISPITKLINLSLAEGCFPSQLKCAVITPLIKKATLPKDELKNYRPVSGLIYISKIIERVVASQLNTHLNSHRLSNVWQSAYRSGHSTESALLRVKNDIHLSIARGDSSALILLDLSAAFDTIDHEILLERLSSWFGLGSTALNWFRSYLSERTQKVKVGNHFSNPSKLPFGVPQGSVLGPLLFIMYTTPISKIITDYSNIHHHLYADDTQVYISVNQENVSSALDQLKDCLWKINNWMSVNKLKLNPDKTEFLLLGTPIKRGNLSHFFPTELLGSWLSPSGKVRNLGVIFDNRLSLTQHVSAVCSSCYYHIRDLSRIRRHLSISVASQIANALVTSRLDYCNSLLSSLTAKDLKRLQSVQNTIARIVTRTPRRSSISPVLKSLHWLPVKFRIKFKMGVLIYKALANGKPDYLASLLTLYSSSYNTRRSNPELRFLKHYNIGSKVSSNRHLSHSFQDAAPRLWNSFPLSVRTASSLTTFRCRLKTHLFSLAYPP